MSFRYPEIPKAFLTFNSSAVSKIFAGDGLYTKLRLFCSRTIPKTHEEVGIFKDNRSIMDILKVLKMQPFIYV